MQKPPKMAKKAAKKAKKSGDSVIRKSMRLKGKVCAKIEPTKKVEQCAEQQNFTGNNKEAERVGQENQENTDPNSEST